MAEYTFATSQTVSPACRKDAALLFGRAFRRPYETTWHPSFLSEDFYRYAL